MDNNPDDTLPTLGEEAKTEQTLGEVAEQAQERDAELDQGWGVPGLFEPTAISIRSRLKMVFYGGAGAGKTILGIRFPKSIVMDCERGWDVYKDVYPNIPFMQISKFEKAEQAVDKLLAAGNKLKAQTLIIDPITILHQDLRATHLTEEAMEGKAFGTAGYSAVERDWNRFLTKLSNLSRRMNVIMTAREKPVFNKDVATFDAGRGLDYTADIVLQLFENPDGRRLARTIKERMMPPRLERHNSYDAWDELKKHYSASIYGHITPKQKAMIDALVDDKKAQSPDAGEKYTQWLNEQFGVGATEGLSSYQAMQVINKLS